VKVKIAMSTRLNHKAFITKECRSMSRKVKVVKTVKSEVANTFTSENRAFRWEKKHAINKSIRLSDLAGKVKGLETVKSEVANTFTTKNRAFRGEKKHVTNRSIRLSDYLSEEKMKVRSLVGIRIFTIVDTVILTGLHQGVWIKARVLRMKENTVDLKVLHPRKWSVVGVAVDVPNQFIRALSDRDLGSFTIPIKFMLDDSVLHLAWNKKMKVDDLKRSINRVRLFPVDQIYFLHNGGWLHSYDPVPNDVIFCIIHRGDRSSRRLNGMMSHIKKQLLNSVRRTESKVSSLEVEYSRSRLYSYSYINENYDLREGKI